MIGISAVEGASRESQCDSLWIKTVQALSKRASSGPAGFAPATASPCEAWFGPESRIQNSGGRREEHEDLGGGGRAVAWILSDGGGGDFLEKVVAGQGDWVCR